MSGAAKKVGSVLITAVAVTFLVAAISKTSGIDQVGEMLVASKLLPKLPSHLAAYTVVILEFLVALGIAIPRTRLAGVMLGAALSGIFVAFAGWRIIADIHVPCSCFGPLFTMSPYQSGGLALLLFSASLFGIRSLSEPYLAVPSRLVKE